MKLQAKTHLPLILVLFVITFYFHLIIYPAVKSSSEKEFSEREQEKLQAIALFAETHLPTGNLDSIHLIIEKYKRNNAQWKILQIEDANGRIIYPLVPRPDFYSNENKMKTFSKALVNENKVLGKIKLISDPDHFMRDHYKNIKNILDTLLVCLFLILGIIAWIQHRIVSEPIYFLISAIKDIYSNHNSFDIVSSRDDELGMLARCILDMRENLQRSQRNLTKESKRLRTILGSLTDGILTINSNFAIVSTNLAAEKILKLDQDELVKLDFREFVEHFSGFARVSIDKVMSDSSETGTTGSIESTFNRYNSETIPVEILFSYFKSANEKIYLLVIRDISTRKANENEILNQRQQIVTINQAQANFITRGDPMQVFDGLLPDLLDLANSKFGFIAGIAQDEDNEKFLRIYTNSVFPWSCITNNIIIGDEESVLEIHEFGSTLHKIVHEGTTFIDNNPTAIFENSEATYTHISSLLGMPLKFGESVVGVLIVVDKINGYNDQTVQLIEPLLNTCAHLIDAVSKSLDRKRSEIELRRAKEQAEIATKSKSNFLATMSHELRTPINGVLGMLHLISKTTLDQQQHRYVETAASSGQMLLSVINDILDFSKIEAGKLDLEFIPFRLPDVITQLIDIFKNQAKQKRIQIISDIDTQLPLLVLGDPTRLSQIISNLISNAIKFTSEGTVTIQVRKHIDSITFSVIDTGIGISPSQQQKLFKAFSQVDSSHTRKYGGTGLGLIICQSLVNAMGGSFTVKSRIGEGSDFSFSIPLDEIDCDGDINEMLLYLAELKVAIMDHSKVLPDLWTDFLHQSNIRDIQLFILKNDIPLVFDAVKHKFDLILVNYDKCITVKQFLPFLSSLINNSQTKLIVVTNSTTPALFEGEIQETQHYVLKHPVSKAGLLNAMCFLFKGNPWHNYQSTRTLNEHNFAGRKLLLVEDNPTNQQVALELLTQVGFSVDLCVNGLEAVKAVQDFDYDIVLMDIQMPIMDGLEACRQIRKLDGKWKNLPIVAMTAHAAKGDTLNSLNAGMDAHITKPIQPEHLFQVLTKFVKPSERPALTSNTVKSDPPPLDCVSSIDGINVTEGINRINGNTKVYFKILKDFFVRYRSSRQSIQSLVEEKSYSEIAAIAHTLKGSGGNIGAERLYSTSATLEKAARTESIPDIESALPEFLDALDQVLEGLSQFNFEETISHDQISPNILGNSDVLQDIEKVINLLDEDIASAESLLDSIYANASQDDVKTILKSSIDALLNYDIETVRAMLLKIVS